tara:strand:- start:836 stop:1567 length:732 start_codon:yes stop_codon:yes gene_type:complete
MRKTLLIIGAGSDIAKSVALKFAENNFNLQLLSRNEKNLIEFKELVETKHKNIVDTITFDILELEKIHLIIKNIQPLPDVILSAVGILGNQDEDEINYQSTIKVLRTNFESPSIILNYFAKKFSIRGYGTIIAISSVAGIRGRKSNFIYGSSKSALISFLSGLRQKYSSNVSFITVLPGFVSTKMTSHKKMNKFLTATPQEVSYAIYNAYLKKKDTVYIKKIFIFIMLIIRVLPEFVYKRLNL